MKTDVGDFPSSMSFGKEAFILPKEAQPVRIEGDGFVLRE